MPETLTALGELLNEAPEAPLSALQELENFEPSSWEEKPEDVRERMRPIFNDVVVDIERGRPVLHDTSFSDAEWNALYRLAEKYERPSGMRYSFNLPFHGSLGESLRRELVRVRGDARSRAAEEAARQRQSPWLYLEPGQQMDSKSGEYVYKRTHDGRLYRYLKSNPEKTWTDITPTKGVLGSLAAREWGEDIPFLGTILAMEKNFGTKDKLTYAMTTLEKASQDPGSVPMYRAVAAAAFVRDWAEDKARAGEIKTTMAARIVGGVVSLVPFAAEIWATGGLAAGVRKGVREGATKLLGKSVAGSRLGRLGAATLAETTVAGARAATVGAPRVGAEFAERTTPGLELQDGKLVVTRPGAATEFFRAFAGEMIEYGTEEAGTYFRAGERAVLQKVLGKAWKETPGKIGPWRTALRKLGFHGMLEEIGEERLADVLRAVFNISGHKDKNIIERLVAEWPDRERLMEEVGIFSFPGAVSALSKARHGDAEEAKALSDLLEAKVPPAEAILAEEGGRLPPVEAEAAPAEGVPSNVRHLRIGQMVQWEEEGKTKTGRLLAAAGIRAPGWTPGAVPVRTPEGGYVQVEGRRLWPMERPKAAPAEIAREDLLDPEKVAAWVQTHEEQALDVVEAARRGKGQLSRLAARRALGFDVTQEANRRLFAEAVGRALEMPEFAEEPLAAVSEALHHPSPAVREIAAKARAELPTGQAEMVARALVGPERQAPVVSPGTPVSPEAPAVEKPPPLAPVSAPVSKAPPPGPAAEAAPEKPVEGEDAGLAANEAWKRALLSGTPEDWGQALRDEDADVREDAPRALGSIGPAAKVAVPALAEALGDEDARVRRGAAWALGLIGPAAKATVPALAEALRDADWNVREDAARALGRIGPAAEAAPEKPGEGEDLETLSFGELREIAEEYDIKTGGMNKMALLKRIRASRAKGEEQRAAAKGLPDTALADALSEPGMELPVLEELAARKLTDRALLGKVTPLLFSESERVRTLAADITERIGKEAFLPERPAAPAIPAPAAPVPPARAPEAVEAPPEAPKPAPPLPAPAPAEVAPEAAKAALAEAEAAAVKAEGEAESVRVQAGLVEKKKSWEKAKERLARAREASAKAEKGGSRKEKGKAYEELRAATEAEAWARGLEPSWRRATAKAEEKARAAREAAEKLKKAALAAPVVPAAPAPPAPALPTKPMTRGAATAVAAPDLPAEGVPAAYAVVELEDIIVEEREGAEFGAPEAYIAEDIVPGKPTEGMVEKALRELREDLGGTTMFAGLRPRVLKNATIVGAHYFAKGLRTLAAWTAKMVETFGNNVRDYLPHIWRRVSFPAVVEKAAAEVAKNAPARYAKEPGLVDEAKAQNFVARLLLSDQFNHLTAVSRLAPEGSATYRTLSEAPRLAERVQARFLQDAKEFLVQAEKDAGLTGKAWWKAYTKILDIALPLARSSAGMQVVPKIQMTAFQRVGYYLNWRDPSTRDELLRAGHQGIVAAGARSITPIKLFPADFEAIIESMPENERKFADAIGDYLSDGPIAHAYQATWLEDQGVKVPLRKHHWPRHRKRGEGKAEQFTFNQFVAQRGERHLEDAGRLQEREPSNDPFIIGDAVEEFMRHVHEVSAYAAFAVPIKKARTLLNDPTFRNSVTHGYKYGPDILRTLADGLRQYEQPTTRSLTGLERALHKFSRNANVALLVGKARVLLFQLLSLVPAAAEINLRHISRAMFGKKAQAREEMHRYSPILHARAQGSTHRIVTPFLTDKTVAEFAGQSGGWFTRAQNAGMKPIHVLDQWTIDRLWRAAKLEQAERGLTGEALMEATALRAEELVELTQSSYSPQSLNAIQRAGRHNPLIRVAFAIFSGQVSKYHNMVVRGLFEYGHSARTLEDKKKLTARVLYPTVVNALGVWLISYGVRAGFKGLHSLLYGGGDDDEKDKSIVEDAVYDIILSIFGNVLVLRDITYAAAQYYRRPYFDPQTNVLSSATLSTITGAVDAVRAGVQAGTGEEYERGSHAGEKKWKVGIWRALDRLASGASVFGGVPYQGAKQLARPLIPPSALSEKALRSRLMALVSPRPERRKGGGGVEPETEENYEKRVSEWEKAQARAGELLADQSEETLRAWLREESPKRAIRLDGAAFRERMQRLNKHLATRKGE
ncbi:MAG: HEAT repeat domain-containing protein [Elusimicrobiota bacterium]